jgi:hypothetical protein
MINASNCIRALVCFIVGALCLLPVSSMPEQAQADAADYVVWRKFLLVDGINSCSQGEEIRLNLAFSPGLVRAPAGTPPATVNAFAQIMDMNGRVLFTGSNETITVNGMRTESVSRAELDVPQTGPLTLVVEWAINAQRDWGTDLPASAEVVDGCTGRVKYHTGQGLTLQHDPVPGAGNVFAVWVTVGFQPVSLALGQTLRLNIEQQWPLVVPPPTAATSDYFLKIEGIEGESRSVDERHLSFLPGQTLVMDFNRDLIREPGDPGTGLLTVWLVAEYRALVSREQLAQMSRQGTVQFPASLHLVDNSNPGGLLLPAVQKLRFYE